MSMRTATRSLLIERAASPHKIGWAHTPCLGKHVEWRVLLECAEDLPRPCTFCGRLLNEPPASSKSPLP